jgi:hypothetical protein
VRAIAHKVMALPILSDVRRENIFSRTKASLPIISVCHLYLLTGGRINSYNNERRRAIRELLQ